jgi:integration host factor subunit alpha
MTKADLVDKVHQNVGSSRNEAGELVDLAFEIIKETLERGENVKISGFGSFMIKHKNSRRGRNPQTGEDLEITARKVVTFKPSGVLRKAMNGGR